MVKRYQCSFNESSMKIIDDYCAENKITRSRFLERAALDFIQAKKVEPELKSMLDEWGQKLEDLLKKSGRK